MVRILVDMTLNRRVGLDSRSNHLISKIMTSYILSTADCLDTVADGKATPKVLARNGN